MLALPIATPATARPLAIMADASLQEAIVACADAWVAAGHERPSLSFGNSRILGERVAALAAVNSNGVRVVPSISLANLPTVPALIYSFVPAAEKPIAMWPCPETINEGMK